MPGADKHLALASEYLVVVQKLALPEHCRPISVAAYYGVMHLFEAMLANRILDGRSQHFTSHHDRIACVLRRQEVFGAKEAKALWSLYDFSYMARYIYEDRTDYAKTPAEPHRGSEIDLEQKLKRSDENLNQIVNRVNRIIRKSNSVFERNPFAEISLPINPAGPGAPVA